MTLTIERALRHQVHFPPAPLREHLRPNFCGLRLSGPRRHFVPVTVASPTPDLQPLTKYQPALGFVEHGSL